MSGSLALDPLVFTPEAISPETAAFNQQLAELFQAMPPLEQQIPSDVRAARESGQSAFGPIVLSDLAVQRTVPGPKGPIPVRVFVPEVVRGAYLHLHGGGWTIGAANASDVRNEEIARRCGLAVVSVDYRLAPENPYPAGPDDCEAAAAWLAEYARAEFGTDRLLIGGESAGAHLSVVTLLRMRDRHGFSGFSGANLVYGAYDLRHLPSAANWGPRPLVLSTPIIDWFLNQFVSPVLRRDPDVSPLFANLRGLPPALFTVGTLDPLLDDSMFMATRWLAAGNAAELAVYPGGVHAFDSFPIEIARQAKARIDRFLSSDR